MGVAPDLGVGVAQPSIGVAPLPYVGQPYLGVALPRGRNPPHHLRGSPTYGASLPSVSPSYGVALPRGGSLT